jgi:Na+/H+-dicarboxylate symporter
MTGTYFIAMIAMVVVGLAIGLTPTHAVSEGSNIFSDLLKLVLDIIPSNLVTPFATDNDMQVIVIATFIGIVLLLLGDKVRTFRKFCDEAGNIINKMMAFVCKTLPLFVYLGVTNLLLSNMLSQVYLVSRIFVISLVGAAITIGITIARTLYVTKQPFSKLFSAQLPSLLINLTTSSQMSAMPESMKCCKEKWGIDQKFTDFGLPLGVVFYMPNGAIMLGAIVWVLTDISLGAVDILVLFKLVLVSVIIAIAAPPIPGSAFAVLPILFSACGTDLSMMPLAVIIGSTVGYLLPAMNGFCLQLELLMTAQKANLIHKEL